MRQCHGLDTLLLAWAIGAPLIWRNQNKFGERKQRSRIKQFRNTLDNIKSGQVLWRTSFSKSNLHAKFFLHSIPYRTFEFLLEETLLRTGQQSQTNLLDLEHGAHLMGPVHFAPNLRIHRLIHLDILHRIHLIWDNIPLNTKCLKTSYISLKIGRFEKTLGTTNVPKGFTLCQCSKILRWISPKSGLVPWSF